MSQSKDVRPPVDPLSDVSWARVERGLWARLDGAAPVPAATPRSRRWIWIALPSVAAAAVIAIVFASSVDAPKPLPAPVATTPPPPVEDSPTRVVSGASPSSVTVGDAHVALDANSAVVMPRTSDSRAVLEHGAAWFSIAPRTGKPFVVVAGDTVVRVIGTKFRVARFEERVTVEVERGVVDVTFRGTTTLLSAGEHWSTEAQVVENTPRVPDRKAPVVKRDDKPDNKPDNKPDGKPEVDPDQAKFEHAQALEVKNPHGAIALYLEVSKGAGKFALPSLYAAGRLAADRGEPRGRILLELYLQRAPRGANADDARIILDRLKGPSR